jgi:serine/threonine protein kinase
MDDEILPSANVRRVGDALVKTLKTAALARREYDVLRELRHPNICTATYVRGVDLVLHYGGPDLLLRRRPNVRSVFSQLASAVAYLHARGYAHLDLKLDNVVCDECGHVRLVDFGLACKDATVDVPCGTTGYMAPEIWSGHAYEPRKADVWSLGVVLFALLHDGMPFAKAHMCDVRYQEFVRTGKLLRSTSKEWAARVLDLCLVVDPTARGTAAACSALADDVCERVKRRRV